MSAEILEGPVYLDDSHHSENVRRMRRIGDESAELSAHLAAATYRMLVLIREFDEGAGWEDFRSCAHWLSWRAGLNLGAAREHVRVSRALKHLPLISESMDKGEVSYSKVRAITRVARPENEEKLLGVARGGTASHVERIVRAWRRAVGSKERDEANRLHRKRYLQTYTDEDGMLVIRGRLTPEVGAAVLRALESVTEVPKDVPAETPTHEQRRADAIGLVAERALEAKNDGSDRYQVVVHVDKVVLEDPNQLGQSVVEDGTYVSAETSPRIACDASKVVMTHDEDGTVLDVGRKTRTVPPAIRRALTHRDRTCRFPGCGLKYCDAHHIEHWANGGETKLDNLVLLCRRHHRSVHEEGFRVEFPPNSEPMFYRPNGRLLPPVPPSPKVVNDPVGVLMERNRDLGLEIDARTSLPAWDGEPLDLDWAMAVLLD